MRPVNMCLVALVIALSISVISVATMPPPPITQEQEHFAKSHPVEAANQDSALLRFWKWTTHEPVAFYTFVLSLFTAVLGGSTIGLWLATKTAAERQAADTEILQRAYIAVDPLGVLSHTDEVGDDRVVAHIGIRNVGNLPAKEVRWILYTEAMRARYRESFPISEDAAFGENVVPPGTLMTQGSLVFRLPLLTGGGPDGGPFLYVWGAVYYRDGFSETPKRTTLFCHRYSYETMPSGVPKYVFLPDVARIHRFGNGAT